MTCVFENIKLEKILSSSLIYKHIICWKAISKGEKMPILFLYTFLK